MTGRIFIDASLIRPRQLIRRRFTAAATGLLAAAVPSIQHTHGQAMPAATADEAGGGLESLVALLSVVPQRLAMVEEGGITFFHADSPGSSHRSVSIRSDVSRTHTSMAPRTPRTFWRRWARSRPQARRLSMPSTMTTPGSSLAGGAGTPDGNATGPAQPVPGRNRSRYASRSMGGEWLRAQDIRKRSGYLDARGRGRDRHVPGCVHRPGVQQCHRAGFRDRRFWPFVRYGRRGG